MGYCPTGPSRKGHTIDWFDPWVVRSLDVERSEVTLPPGTVPVPEGMIGLGTRLVGLELLDAPADAEALSVQPSSTEASAASPKPSKAMSEAASALAPHEWAAATTRHLREVGKISEGTTQAALARLLAVESEEAVKTGRLRRAYKASYLENQLKAWGIWPLK
jgi:hypothetical protein